VKKYRIDLENAQNRRENSAQFQGAGKAIPLQAWTGPEGSRRLRLPGGRLSALRTGRLYTAGNTPGTYSFPLEAELTPGL